jgi:hypothetical protein
LKEQSRTHSTRFSSSLGSGRGGLTTANSKIIHATKYFRVPPTWTDTDSIKCGGFLDYSQLLKKDCTQCSYLVTFIVIETVRSNFLVDFNFSTRCSLAIRNNPCVCVERYEDIYVCKALIHFEAVV